MSKPSPDLVRGLRRAVFVALIAGIVGGCSNTSGQMNQGGTQQGGAAAVVPPAPGPLVGQQVTASATAPFDFSVTWQVPDTGCGTIAAGVYTAPAVPANCRVLVTSNADPSKSATALVTVGQGPDTVWEPLKVGAGGWLTSIDADKSGTTFVLRTDTYGAYVGDGVGTWRQVVNAASMPASFVARMGDWIGEGVYEIRVAPSDPNRIYMVYQKKVFKSVNRGATWTQTAFSYSGTMDPNEAYRYWGEKAAVDPANPDVVYVGTVSNGLYVTFDAGATWSVVGGVGVPGVQGITGIVFDESSGTTGGRTNTIYACRNGTGVYRSANSGSTWALLAGSPTTVTHAAVATDGVYYAANMGTTIHKYAAGAWTQSASTGQTLHTIATDPFNPARIIAGRDSGHLAVSTDRGASWLTGGMIWTMTRTAADVPWLAFANESYMSSGAQRFDPVVPNKLWFSEGIGVWYTTAPDNPSVTAWQSRSAGIEQMVGRDVCVPPGRPNVIAAGMDRSVWVLPKANSSYPSRYGSEPTPSSALLPAWSVNYSVANPAHIVAIINATTSGDISSYSLDDGATWTKFPVQPPAGTSGDIIATSIDNIIAVIGGAGAWRSTNRGASWTALSLPGATSADNGNLHNGYNNKKHILAIDGATPTTIYLYFYGHGVYRSLDSGATWALVNSTAFNGEGANWFWQAKLRAVPGQAGHLFATAGQAGGVGAPNPSATALWRSTNGGASWTTVPGLSEPYDIALGKAAPGQTYPAIYVVGWYNNVYGIWRSTDNASTWRQIGPFPFNSVDEINVIAASQDVYGDVYVAFNGSGWGYGKLKSP